MKSSNKKSSANTTPHVSPVELETVRGFLPGAVSSAFSEVIAQVYFLGKVTAVSTFKNIFASEARAT